ncbi:MAG: hypothetical protein ACTSO9_18570 [Candidatus Helarchaeota archaeon]
MILIGKEKNYRKLAKKAYDDKVSNIIFVMKFLDSKGGLELVREYFAEAIPDYVLQYAGTGSAGKMILKQLLKRNPVANIKKIIEKVIDDSEFLIPKDNYEPLEIKEEEVISKIKCKYIRDLIKKGKKFKCDFDLREYYCNNACIPLLSKIYKDIFLNFDVEITKSGCIQRISIDKTQF